MNKKRERERDIENLCVITPRKKTDRENLPTKTNIQTDIQS